MFIKRRSNILFRDFQSFGYLTDNRNFGYKVWKPSEGFVGDKVVSPSGAAMLSVLTRIPQHLSEIVERVHCIFPDVDTSKLQGDVLEFFRTLEEDGFLISGKSPEDCESRDTRFSYRDIGAFADSDIIAHEEDGLPQSSEDFFGASFKETPLLTNVHIEVTSRCNERCIHCYIPSESRCVDLDFATIEKMLRECREMNVLHLIISGGEPLLREDFLEILRLIRQHEFSVNILSNLTLILPDIVTEMRLNPLLGVQVSLYSMNPDIHDNITGVRGSFERTKSSILMLVENNIPLQIACPILKNNLDSYQEVVRWAKALNVGIGTDYVVLAKHNHSTENLACRLSIEEIDSLIRARTESDPGWIARAEDEAIRNSQRNEDDNICSVCHSSICVNDRGDVYPCAGWQSYVVGSIKTTSIKDIWQSSEAVKYLRRLRRRDFPKCVGCSDRDFCTMCLVRNANESPSGNPLVVNEFFCKVASLTKTAVRSRQVI